MTFPTDLPKELRSPTCLALLGKAGHRLEKNFHNIDVIMEGKLSEIVEALQAKFAQ